MIPRGFVTEDQWINSIVDHWTGSQRKSWRLLDRRLSNWASHLVWLRKVEGRPSGEVKQAPQLPSACLVDSLAAPPHSVAESMKDWWEVNSEAVRVCSNTPALGEGARPQTAIAAVSMSHSPQNPRYVQIDRRARAERIAIDHMVAPESIKNEAREQVSDAAAVDRYAADVDGNRP
jgi:hypothetical protein